jgi:hypothetical protein
MGTPEVPLEHAHETIEHHAHGSSEPWVMGVALTAAILAALAAVTALFAEHFSNEAMLERIEGNDKWSESQAQSIKEKEIETKEAVFERLGRKLSDDDEKKLRDYPTKKEDNRRKADEHHLRSEAYMHKHLPLSVGLTMFQVGIAVGAISVLTKRRAYWYVSLVFGGLGVCCLIWGFFA